MNSPNADAGAEIETSAERYTRIAIVLHWTIAALILYNLLGFVYFNLGLPRPAHRLFASAHFWSGLAILALTLVRIAWRLLHAPPPLHRSLGALEAKTAHVAHFLLYAAMLLIPLTGWATVSAHAPAGSPGERYAQSFAKPWEKQPAAAGKPAAPAQQIIMPPAIAFIERIGQEPGGVPPQMVLHDEFHDWHIAGAYLLAALLILHIAGALKHEWFDGHAQLGRMGLRTRHRRRRGAE